MLVFQPIVSETSVGGVVRRRSESCDLLGAKTLPLIPLMLFFFNRGSSCAKEPGMNSLLCC